MPYAPKPGDIGLVKMPGTVGRVIRSAQWLNGEGYKDYEHAFTVVGNMIRGGDTGPDDSMKIVEAMPGGALLSPLSRYAHLEPVYLRCPDHFRDPVADAAMSFVGVPYSAADYAALAAHRFHIPVPGLKRYIESSGHMICSQLADRAAGLGGWHIFTDGRWPGYVTPAGLYVQYLRQLTVQ
jgi:hypothetical protein